MEAFAVSATKLELITKDSAQRADVRLEIAAQLMSGICANPGFWAQEAIKAGMQADTPVVTLLSGIALEQADNLISVAINARAHELRMAQQAANQEHHLS